MTSEILETIFGAAAAMAVMAGIFCYFWFRKQPELPSDYELGHRDGYMQACKDNYERQERLRNHDPEKCELCRRGEQRPHSHPHQREASQEA